MRKLFGVTSRRGVMQAALAALAAGSLTTEAVAQGRAEPQRLAQGAEKLAQKVVQYQNMPKDGAKCSTCVNFVKPNSCKIVAGVINPNGWCVAYAPMSG